MKPPMQRSVPVRAARLNSGYQSFIGPGIVRVCLQSGG